MTTLQSIREGILISTLSDGLNISRSQIDQLRSQRLHDVLNYGKQATVQFSQKPRVNIINRIVSLLIY